MPESLQDYESVSIYQLDPEMQEKLLSTHRECVFNWSTKDGWPMGVIMSYLWADGRFWLTAGAHRHRISAVRRDPRVSVVVTSTGTELGGGKTVTVVFDLPPHPGYFIHLVKKLKAHCGTGGVLKQGRMEIQWDQRDKVQAYLEQMGFKVRRAGG